MMFTIKYSKVLIEIFDSIEKDPKYEELFPILSFSFKDCKKKLVDILAHIDTVKVHSKQEKHTQNNGTSASAVVIVAA